MQPGRCSQASVSPPRSDPPALSLPPPPSLPFPPRASRKRKLRLARETRDKTRHRTPRHASPSPPSPQASRAKRKQKPETRQRWGVWADASDFCWTGGHLPSRDEHARPAGLKREGGSAASCPCCCLGLAVFFILAACLFLSVQFSGLCLCVLCVLVTLGCPSIFLWHRVHVQSFVLVFPPPRSEEAGHSFASVRFVFLRSLSGSRDLARPRSTRSLLLAVTALLST